MDAVRYGASCTHLCRTGEEEVGSLSRKGKRKGKSFQPKPSPIDAIMQARQAHRDAAQGHVELRQSVARSPLAPLRHRGGNR